MAITEARPSTKGLQWRRVTLLMAWSLLPLILALGLVTVVVDRKTIELSNSIADLKVATMTADEKQSYLKQNMRIALRKLKPLYESSDPSAMDKAKKILESLRYNGQDGYFFVYGLDGTCLFHPISKEIIGENRFHVKNADGIEYMRSLIEQSQANEQGGFVTYEWDKPSKRHLAKKLGYGVLIPQWNWLLGTGLYLDPVDAAKSLIISELEIRVQEFRKWLIAIAFAGACIMALISAARLILENRYGVEQVSTLSYLLHDGVRAYLTSFSRLLRPVAEGLLDDPAARVREVIGYIEDVDEEIRQAAHSSKLAAEQHRPVSRTTRDRRHRLSLHKALVLECNSITEDEKVKGGQLQVKLVAPTSIEDSLSETAKDELLTIAREALKNVLKHASTATRADVTLEQSGRSFKMSVRNNGNPDADLIHKIMNKKGAFGVKSMADRARHINGELLVSTDGEFVEVAIIVTLLPAAAATGSLIEWL